MNCSGPQNTTSWWRFLHFLWSRKQRMENKYPKCLTNLLPGEASWPILIPYLSASITSRKRKTVKSELSSFGAGNSKWLNCGCHPFAKLGGRMGLFSWHRHLEFWLCHLIATWPQAGYFSLFPHLNMRIRTYLTLLAHLPQRVAVG